jgi:hypothetical protein
VKLASAVKQRDAACGMLESAKGASNNILDSDESLDQVVPNQYIFAVSDIGNGETAYFPMPGLDCGTEFCTPADLLSVGSDESTEREHN